MILSHGCRYGGGAVRFRRRRVYRPLLLDMLDLGIGQTLDRFGIGDIERVGGRRNCRDVSPCDELLG
ncbi:MAG TPA: hypothetical protein VLG66_02805 [Alphaproteobacteria bacterium]|nr:hypothetical protein [Alphaproteobacteria bacterium]